MDSHQDLTINSLTVLDDTCAIGDRVASVVINGGLNVAKNIITCDIDTSIIVAEKAKITECMSVQKNVYIEGEILPFTCYSTASLGNCNNKWNNIHAINADIQQISNNVISTKNLSTKNIQMTTCAVNINDDISGSPIYQIDLETSITIINLTSIFENDRNVTITLPLSTFENNHVIKKIIFKQNKCNNIIWNYNSCENVSLNSFEQVFELINIHGMWKFIDYTNSDKKITLDNADKIEKITVDNAVNIQNINDSQDIQDNSLNILTDRIDTLIDFNNFLSVSENTNDSILDFVDKNLEFRNDISELRDKLNIIDVTISGINGVVATNATNFTTNKNKIDYELSDISANLLITNNVAQVFKNVTDMTFRNIDNKLLCINSSISNLTLKSSEVTLDMKRTKELIDMVDKKLHHHISDTDAKLAYLNDNIKHINERMDLVMNKCGVHFH